MSTTLREKTVGNGTRFQLVSGDITVETVDAIVNAANSELQHGGGVARLISMKGGESIQRESNEWVAAHGSVSHAEPAWTRGGNMPCKFVIHAVGPIWGEDGTETDNDNQLKECVWGSLKLADKKSLKSISIPAISTGIFGFPKERAAKLIYSEIERYFEKNKWSNIALVHVIVFDQPTVDAFVSQWR